ncbi:hypothetical protein [Bacillus thuringiensis]|uniref:hypothetical protein n=1 Tax=Bacillus thuringiensis TaxID=1428 RepID=UPI001EE78FB2|nr:hypothetical protein [Bacillus thuringiensis]
MKIIIAAAMIRIQTIKNGGDSWVSLQHKDEDTGITKFEFKFMNFVAPSSV